MNKQNINLTILLLSVMMLTSFSSAEGDIGTVKQFDCIDLYNQCPTCSYINLTAIKYPNVTTNTLEIAMIRTGNNYIHQFCDTGSLGLY